MENDEHIIQRIEDILGGLSDNFRILDQQVDVDLQMEYFEFSRNQEKPSNIEDIIAGENDLYDESITDENKRSLLVNLASIEKPEAYRIIERFVPLASPELRDWAIMAKLESRMLLETVFSEESQIFISTGLGGREGKLRYYVVIFSDSESEFSETQKRLIINEIELTVGKSDGDLESVSYHHNYIAFLLLLPISVAVKDPIKNAIDECNSLAKFVKDDFIITNVKVLSDKEVDDIISGKSEYDIEE